MSADIGRQLDCLHEADKVGFERIYLPNIARGRRERFIETSAAPGASPILDRGPIEEALHRSIRRPHLARKPT